MHSLHLTKSIFTTPVRAFMCLCKAFVFLCLCIPGWSQAANDLLLYETSFESPTFVAGSPIRGQDQWEMFHDGEAISIATNNAHSGDQCLRFQGANLEQVGPNVSRSYCFTRALDAFASNPPPIVEMSTWVRLDGTQIGTDGSPTNDWLSANFYAAGSASGQPTQLGGFVVSSAGRIFADNYRLSVPFNFGVYYHLTLRVDFIARTLRYWVNEVLLGESVLTGSADRLLSAYVEMIGSTEPNSDPFRYNPVNYTALFDDYRIVSIPLSPVNTVIEFAARSYPFTNFLADEFDASAKLRIVRRGFTNSPVRITLSTADGTAISGQDYSPVSTFVTFAAGEIEKIVEVPLLGDDEWAEPDKTFSVRLGGLPPGASSTRPRANVLIRDGQRPGGVDRTWVSDLGLAPRDMEYASPDLILRQPDGKWIISVTVYNEGYTSGLYWRLVRINPNGSVDPTYPILDTYPTRPELVLGERVVTALPDQSLLVVDYESQPGNDGLLHYVGHRLRYKLNPDGSIDSRFPSLTNSTAAGCCSGFNLVAQPDGNILVVGNITNPTWLNDQKMPWLFRLRGDGLLDDTFQVPEGIVGRVNLLRNGQILIQEPLPPEKIYRLNSDGTLDNTFDPPSGISFVFPPLLEGLPEEQMLISGRSQGSTRLYKLQKDGSIDPDFQVGVASFLNSFSSFGSIDLVLQQLDGKLLVAGAFRTFNGQVRNSLVRLNANGALDPTFNTGKGFVGTGLSATDPGQVQQMFPLPNGKLFVAGIFDQLNGKKVTSPVLLNEDGSRDPEFEGSMVDVYQAITPGYGLSVEDPTLILSSQGIRRLRMELPLRVVSINPSAGHGLQIIANALENSLYTLQGTFDFVEWKDIATQQASTNRIEFFDVPAASPAMRVYRVKQD